MKKQGSKILYGILIIGIIVSIISLFNSKGGSGLYNFLTIISITSIILFIGALITLISSFKENRSKIHIWFILIISSPITLMTLSNLTKNIYFNSIQTTTPKEYLNNEKVSKNKYENDRIKIKQLIENLIKKRIIYEPSKLALRSFNGKNYNDTIDRSWAIDIPIDNIEYKEIIIDTLFYSNNKVIAGMLITKTESEFSNDFIYDGYGFTYKMNNIKPIEILKYSVSANKSYICSKSIRKEYLVENRLIKGQYNMNDNRFLTELEKQIK